MGRASLVAAADEHTRGLLPLLRALRAEGTITIGAVTRALNKRKIPVPRGSRWHVSSVANLLARAQTGISHFSRTDHVLVPRHLSSRARPSCAACSCVPPIVVRARLGGMTTTRWLYTADGEASFYVTGDRVYSHPEGRASFYIADGYLYTFNGKPVYRIEGKSVLEHPSGNPAFYFRE